MGVQYVRGSVCQYQQSVIINLTVKECLSMSGGQCQQYGRIHPEINY